jgi:8-oxo-dGTP pyrophosphatase MutT (NUDIX family)
MVRQYRQGTREVTLEIPGGMVDPNETPAAGARRELLEETGFEAEELELLGKVDTNPAIQSNATYTYRARGLRKVAELSLDQAEDIEVVEVDLDEIDALVDDGTITHALVIAAFYWLDRSRKGERGLPLDALLDELARGQQDQVATLAKRINAKLTNDDLLSPQDFPELANDPDFNYQDGMLAGIEAARMALRRLRKEQ